MTTKLVIYDHDICGKPAYYSENANADGSIKSWGYCGISEEKAKITPIKEVYEGVAAAVKLWDMAFDTKRQSDVTRRISKRLKRQRTLFIAPPAN